MALSTIPFSALSSDASKQGVNFRNLIINGDMSIAQRGTSATGLTGVAYNTIDRWQTSITNQGTWTQSQSTDVPTGQGFAKSFKMDCTTADSSPASGDSVFIRQKFEGQMLQQTKKGTSNAESLTLSFWVKSNKTGTYIAELYDVDNSRQISKAYTISSASTWEKKTLTFEGDTNGAFGNDNGLSLQLAFWLGSGSDYNSGTLSTSWTSATQSNRAVGNVNLADSTSNEWYITGVQLEVGTSASDFEFLPYDVNLQRCKRYYQNTFKGTSASVTDEIDEAVVHFYFNPPMRTAPTMSLISGSSISIDFTYHGSATLTSPTFDNATTTFARAYNNNLSPNMTNYLAGFLQLDQVQADAEL